MRRGTAFASPARRCRESSLSSLAGAQWARSSKNGTLCSAWLPMAYLRRWETVRFASIWARRIATELQPRRFDVRRPRSTSVAGIGSSQFQSPWKSSRSMLSSRSSLVGTSCQLALPGSHGFRALGLAGRLPFTAVILQFPTSPFFFVSIHVTGRPASHTALPDC